LPLADPPFYAGLPLPVIRAYRAEEEGASALYTVQVAGMQMVIRQARAVSMRDMMLFDG
jgi:hypothetical protein